MREAIIFDGIRIKVVNQIDVKEDGEEIKKTSLHLKSKDSGKNSTEQKGKNCFFNLKIVTLINPKAKTGQS